MPELRVVAPTHNPRPDYLQRTLAALSVQSLKFDYCELVLIENANSQSLAESARLADKGRPIAMPWLVAERV